VINTLLNEGYKVFQFGMPTDIAFSNVCAYNHLPFFDQVKRALACKMSIGTDSGNMWVVGAYSHPAIHLMTQWLPGHTKNKFALAPKNINGRDIFAEGGVNNIKHDRVIETVKEMMK
jgi:peroxiredoxin